MISTGDGSVKAHSLSGNVDLHTGDGSITVEGLKGDIKLRTGDGSVEARGLDGKVNADSGDGHIKLEGRFDSLNIRTGDGGVEAHANNGSRMNSAWNIHTGDGSVDMTLPGDLQANIDASTGDGHISLGHAGDGGRQLQQFADSWEDERRRAAAGDTYVGWVDTVE